MTNIDIILLVLIGVATLSFLALLTTFSVVYYFLGKLANKTYELQSKIERAEELSVKAITAAESLNKSTVIQRIVEVYKRQEQVPEDLQKIQEEFEKGVFGQKRELPKDKQIIADFEKELRRQDIKDLI